MKAMLYTYELFYYSAFPDMFEWLARAPEIDKLDLHVREKKILKIRLILSLL